MYINTSCFFLRANKSCCLIATTINYFYSKYLVHNIPYQILKIFCYCDFTIVYVINHQICLMKPNKIKSFVIILGIYNHLCYNCHKFYENDQSFQKKKVNFKGRCTTINDEPLLFDKKLKKFLSKISFA